MHRRPSQHKVLILNFIAVLTLVPTLACKRTGQKKTRANNTEQTLKKSDHWTQGKLPSNITEGTPKKGGTLTIQLFSEPHSLNPIVDSDWWGGRIVDHRIYQSLVGIDPYDDPDYKYTPELATHWDIAEDNLTYTFHLRKDVRWHDGKPFSSKDVIATFDKVQDPKTKAVHLRAYTQELKSYKALGPHRVQFVFKKPYFLALDDPFNSTPIQPSHIISKIDGAAYNEANTNPLNRHPIGTGPYRFEQWQSNQRIVLARNENYWNRPPYLDKLIFRLVKDATIGLQLAERGELDVVTRIQAAQWINMQKPGPSNSALKKNFYRSKFFDANYAWIGWNQERAFFKDKNVRRALTMLIDRPGLIQKLQHNLPKETTCHFYWASPACDPSLKPLPYDRITAAKLLDLAGWKDHDGDGIRDKNGTPFRFSFMLPASSAGSIRMATKIKDDFGRAGIDIDLQKIEWSAFTKRLRTHEFDACTLIWGGGARGEPTQIWHSSSIKGGSNYISFHNERADKLMEKARTTLDANTRNQLYREFGRILHEEQPYTWLYVTPRLTLINKKFKGIHESLMYWQFEDWWKE